MVVVGARCAGSPVATMLARAGLSVALVDRARFPSDARSTHLFQTEGIACLARLGVLGRVLATGAPIVNHIDLRLDDFHAREALPLRPDDAGAALCVRRMALDAILVDAAAEAGADVRTGQRVVGLIERDDRVAGVRVIAERGEETLGAQLVVGADGSGSTVARLVGARQYNVVPNQRFGYWGYYEGARSGAMPTAVFHRWAEELVVASPTDNGLYLVIVIPPLGHLERFRADVGASWNARVDACGPVNAVLAGARRIGALHAAITFPAFFRESAGPGWVLVGDAGHVCDPTAAQGISDALRQAERLAPAIVAGLGGTLRLDAAMAAWWRWRDDDAAEMHWFSSDLGRAGSTPAVVVEMFRRLHRDPLRRDLVWELLSHRKSPSAVITPYRLLEATADLATRRGSPSLTVLADTWALIRDDARHRRRNRHPVFGTPPRAQAERQADRAVPAGR